MAVTILQYINVSNQQVVHLKLKQCCISIITQQNKKKEKRKEKKEKKKACGNIETVWVEEYEILTRRDTCTLRFLAALSTVAKSWKGRGCPSTDEWITKRRYTHSGILLSH